MFRVTRYPMISRTESGRVGYRKKYWVAGRSRVPAGHWQGGASITVVFFYPIVQISKLWSLKRSNRGGREAERNEVPESYFLEGLIDWWLTFYFRTGKFVVKCFEQYRHVKLEWNDRRINFTKTVYCISTYICYGFRAFIWAGKFH